MKFHLRSLHPVSIALAMLVLHVSIFPQIIDMHLHSYTKDGYFGGRQHPTGVSSPKTVEDHLNETIAEMDKHDIRYAVVSGPMESVDRYVEADPRFIPGYSDPGSIYHMRILVKRICGD